MALEVRSNEDPYMVFTYTHYNLGTDFSIFYYLFYISLFLSIYAVGSLLYLFCFKLERKPKPDSTQAPTSYAEQN